MRRRELQLALAWPLLAATTSLTTINLDTANIAYKQAATQSHTLAEYDPGKSSSFPARER